jgi:pSer/pThr/pTyr-binding forkhead associated (FHA) protein
MKAKLTVIEARSNEHKMLISDLPITIGRGSEAGVRLADSWISRCHCEIDAVDGMLVIRDLGSKHGTLVNRQQVRESTLLPGDEIMIGLTSLRVSLDDSESSDCWENEAAMA